MENITITTIQTSLRWEQPTANRNHFDQLLSSLKVSTDLIVLPEMFTTGFSMNAKEVAETWEGPSVDWMRDHAKQLDTAICGSIIVEEKGKFYNRLAFVKPNGDVVSYDKRHLFSLAKEHETYTSGVDKIIVEWRGWRICPLICYDLRFPVFSRNVEGYDLLIYVANWPSPRAKAWKSLLEARAIENISYTIGVNRVGEDEKGLIYNGDTSVVDYAGKVLYRISHEEALHTLTLNKKEQDSFRSKFPFLNDKDKFSLA